MSWQVSTLDPAKSTSATSSTHICVPKVTAATSFAEILQEEGLKSRGIAYQLADLLFWGLLERNLLVKVKTSRGNRTFLKHLATYFLGIATCVVIVMIPFIEDCYRDHQGSFWLVGLAIALIGLTLSILSYSRARRR